MKIYYTENTYIHGVIATKSEEGVELSIFGQQFDADNVLRTCESPDAVVTITEEMVRRHLGPRGMTDMCHVYVEFAPGSTSNVRMFNRAIETYLDKRDGTSYAMNAKAPVLAQIYIPFSDSPFADWAIRVNANPNIKSEFPADALQIGSSSDELHDFAAGVYPSLAVIAAADTQDGCKEIVVQVTANGGYPVAKAGVKVLAKWTAGYVNKAEATTDSSGRATFKARRLDLDAEDAMSVQFGFKFWTNLSNVNV